MDYDFLARERALVMAQCDYFQGKIEDAEIIKRARLYEEFLVGKPEDRVSSASAEVLKWPGR